MVRGGSDAHRRYRCEHRLEGARRICPPVAAVQDGQALCLLAGFVSGHQNLRGQALERCLQAIAEPGCPGTHACRTRAAPQPLCPGRLLSAHGDPTGCWRVHSALTHTVNAIEAINDRFHAACEGIQSGQPPVLGSSANAQRRLPRVPVRKLWHPANGARKPRPFCEPRFRWSAPGMMRPSAQYDFGKPSTCSPM